MIDLHIHTVASDGQHSAAEIVAMAAELKLSAIAIADHNSVDSVAEGEAEAKKVGIDFAPAIELDTIFRGRDLHLLGYFIAYASTACRDWLDQIYRAKLGQTQQRVAKLCDLGFVIDYHELMSVSAGKLPTGAHYISAMKLHPENFQNPDYLAFIDGPRSNSPYLNFYLDWLRAGRPAFVPLLVQPAEAVVKKIRELGGVPILAHPFDTPEPDVHALLDAGLMGLEVYTSYHDAPTTARFLALARSRDALITAGSDFHGKAVKPDVKLAGVPKGDDEFFVKLKAAAC